MSNLLCKAATKIKCLLITTKSLGPWLNLTRFSYEFAQRIFTHLKSKVSHEYSIYAVRHCNRNTFIILTCVDVNSRCRHLRM